jgi:hypothetical protein
VPYEVERGEVIGAGGVVYKVGDEVPGKFRELDDMVEAGSVRWVSAKEKAEATAAGDTRDQGDDENGDESGETGSSGDAGDEGDSDSDDSGDEHSGD